MPGKDAFAVASSKEGDPHIININSGLIDLMTDDELRFVVGHEIGHLMNRDTKLLRLIYFVFPHNTVPPLVLQYKIRLWQQLSELVADRYGYMAIPNLEVCVSAFFKMASGLDPQIAETLRKHIYFSDYKTLISMNRSNGGATFFCDGYLIRKYARRALPDTGELSKLFQSDETEELISRSTSGDLTFQGFLLYVFAVMLLL